MKRAGLAEEQIIEVLKEAKAGAKAADWRVSEPSVGSVGVSYDNALAETINGLFKAEVIHRRGHWRQAGAEEIATLERVDWFNHRRILEPIGNVPAAEAEPRYYAQLGAMPLAA